MAQTKEPIFTQEIRTSKPPEIVWNALVNPKVVSTYHLAPLSKIELKKGGIITYGTTEEVMISGTVTECEPNKKLSHTFRFGAARHPGVEQDGDTLVTYEIRVESKETILKVTHSGFKEENQTFANVTGGWPFILKSLKARLDPE